MSLPRHFFVKKSSRLVIFFVKKVFAPSFFCEKKSLPNHFFSQKKVLAPPSSCPPYLPVNFASSLKRYEDQRKENDSRYCICAERGDKIEGSLLKRCSCTAFIDRDGKAKCKSCKEEWDNDSDLSYGDCKKCGFGY